MTSTISVLVSASGPVRGTRLPSRSSVSRACAATAEMSASAIGAVDADAYGPPTTSPARIWAAHIPAKFDANTVGRRLIHSRPDPAASSSTSLLRSPRNRDGWREKSSSALMADSATSRVTPAARAAATVAAMSSPSAREFRNTASAPGMAASAESNDVTPGGKSAVPGWRVIALTSMPASASSATRGRPTFPVAPVTTTDWIMVRSSCDGCLSSRTGDGGEKLRIAICNFSGRRFVVHA